MDETEAFFDLYRHGFVRAAVAVPEVRVAHTGHNVAQSTRLIEQAAEAFYIWRRIRPDTKPLLKQLVR